MNKYIPIIKKNNNKINSYCIFGERCSGSNFLQNALDENFHIEVNNHQINKHFFGQKPLPDNDDLLFIGIVRDPYTWLNSLYKYPYWLQKNMRKSKYNFLNLECWSQFKHLEITQDRHIYTKQRYKNIFELRHIKNYFLYEDMKILAKNYILIKYEDLRDNYEETLNIIKEEFNLNTKDNYPVTINKYCGRGNLKKKIFTIDKEYIFTKEEIYLNKNFNRIYEEKFNYI